MTDSLDWRSLAAAKRAAVIAKIPEAWRLPKDILTTVHQNANYGVLDIPRSCGILTHGEVELTEQWDACDLLKKMATRQISAEDVIIAFSKRAAIAHQLTNCLTEVMFHEALQRAKKLDIYLAREGKPIGPLHGLPISVKDTYNVNGVQSTIGYVSFLDRPVATENSALVDVLLELGAIIHVKTNVSQSLMTADSDNGVFGRTLNPNKLCLTAGGSSGGEGALIKLRGSVLGMATDMAGSIRIPAFANGVFGFRPTTGRLPFGGKVMPFRDGATDTGILPVTGPLGVSVRDLAFFMKTVSSVNLWERDESVLAVPWRSLDSQSHRDSTHPSLRLGLITEDQEVPLHPSMLRTMSKATEKLRQDGHTVIDITAKVPSLLGAAKLAWKFFQLDPSKTAIRHIEAGAEPAVPSLAAARFPEQDDWKPSLDDMFDMYVERRRIRKIFKNILAEHKLDGFLIAPYQSPAPKHDQYGVTTYTVLANVLDYPAAVIPFLNAQKDLDQAFLRDVDYVPLYDADDFEGAPCAVQIVGRPMRDEELMQIVGILAAVLGHPESHSVHTY